MLPPLQLNIDNRKEQPVVDLSWTKSLETEQKSHDY